MPGGNKKGGGLKSSPVYKMKGFSGFGDSPVKQRIKDVTPGSRVTGPKSLGGPNPPKGVDVEKRYMKGMRDRLASSKQKWNTRGSVFEEPSTKRKFSKSARNIGKKVGFGKSLAKFFGGKALGIGGFMFGTLGTGLTMEAQNRERFGKKNTMSDSQRRDVGNELKKAVYEGNKKRYGKSK